MTAASRRISREGARRVRPRLGRAYLRVLRRALRPTREPRTDPALPADLAGRLGTDPAHLRAYRRVCGLGEGAWLPPLYPQVLAFPLHLELLGDPQMPSSPLGMIHLAQAVRMEGGLAEAEDLEARVGLEPAGHHRRGSILRLVTEVESGSGRWIGESLILFPGVRLSGEGPVLQPPELPGGMDETCGEVRVDGSTARRYARVSGDWNPIHLGRLPARLLGQRRPMVHGMWSLARLLAVAASTPGREEIGRAEAWFTSPLFYPAVAQVSVNAERTGFCLREPRRQRAAVWARLAADPLVPGIWQHAFGSPVAGTAGTE